MDERLTSAIIGALVGVLFGGAVATIGVVGPIRKEQADMRVTLATLEEREKQMAARIEMFEKQLGGRIESVKRNITRQINAVLFALGRRDLAQLNDDEEGIE